MQRAAGLNALAERVARCRRCPRLVAHREGVAREKKREFRDWEYWGRPVPGFGDPGARLLIVGLAPAAHGANRTGRMFTGDSSGAWLYEALHRYGFANQPTSTSRDDGLRLVDCYVTAPVRCAPPANKPTAREFASCQPYLEEELTLLTRVRVVLTLGKLGHDACRRAYRLPAFPPFEHGTATTLANGVTLVSSYHPSRQNTNTGRLTRPMWHGIFRRARALLGALALAVTACGDPAPPPPLPAGSFAFAVFGDGPYSDSEDDRYARVIDEVNAAELAWFLHVGDILWRPCSDMLYAQRFNAFQQIRHPVVYTPGDNEWTDCHERRSGGYEPLERLGRLRSIFFAQPGRSLGQQRMVLVSQGADSAWSEFVENARWRRGGFLFLTAHLVGSSNGKDVWRGRGARHDEEVARRTAAAQAWIREGFRIARADSMRGLVIAFHGNPDLERSDAIDNGFGGLVPVLARGARAFGRPVLVIHGDTHEQRVDQPVRDSAGVVRNLTRLETFGSPDIGWVRVVIDSLAGAVTAIEPRRMSWLGVF